MNNYGNKCKQGNIKGKKDKETQSPTETQTKHDSGKMYSIALYCRKELTFFKKNMRNIDSV